jgi:hypothetical protein
MPCWAISSTRRGRLNLPQVKGTLGVSDISELEPLRSHDLYRQLAKAIGPSIPAGLMVTACEIFRLARITRASCCANYQRQTMLLDRPRRNGCKRTGMRIKL